MNVIFVHGLESSPKGTKATLLREKFGAKTPNVYRRSFYDQEKILGDLINELNPVLLVGSSLGALAAIFTVSRAKTLPAHLLLLAPAVQPFDPARAEELKAYEGVTEAKSLPMPKGLPTTVIHGTRDEIIDMPHVETFCQTSGAKLITVDDTHRLGASLDLICETISGIIRKG